MPLDTHDRQELEERLAPYFDKNVSFERLASGAIGPVAEAARFDPRRARDKVLAAGGEEAGRYTRFAVHPLDNQWCFHSTVRPLWNEPRPDMAEQQAFGNLFLVSRIAARRPDEGVPLVATRALPNDHLLDPNCHPIPVQIHRQSADLFGKAHSITANLSNVARLWLKSLDWDDPDGGYAAASGPWLHALAIAYSPAWLHDNHKGILAGWPRVPLPSKRAKLDKSISLGERVAALLDPDQQVTGITAGKISPVFLSVGSLTRDGGGQLTAADLVLTAGWGHGGKGSPVMPGQGKTTQLAAYDERVVAALEIEAVQLGLPLVTLTERLGPPVNLWLNDKAYWASVPSTVWNFSIGGYPVIKKWLSYREEGVLGRPMTKDEARNVTNLIRRLTALVLLGPALDANYQACRDDAADWSALGRETLTR